MKKITTSKLVKDKTFLPLLLEKSFGPLLSICSSGNGEISHLTFGKTTSEVPKTTVMECWLHCLLFSGCSRCSSKWCSCMSIYKSDPHGSGAFSSAWIYEGSWTEVKEEWQKEWWPRLLWLTAGCVTDPGQAGSHAAWICWFCEKKTPCVCWGWPGCWMDGW